MFLIIIKYLDKIGLNNNKYKFTLEIIGAYQIDSYQILKKLALSNIEKQKESVRY